LPAYPGLESEQKENETVVCSDMATPSPAPTPTTTGELLFQDYLDAMHYSYEFEREFAGKGKRPDYTVTKSGLFLFDVKDFERHTPLGFGFYDPYPRIREKIEEGREKFQEFKEFPCSLVLKNNGNVLVDLETVDIMLGSMYGDSGFSFPVDTSHGVAVGPITPAFLGRGKMIRPTHVQNTTISALITLRQVPVGMRQFRKMVKEYPDLNIEDTLAAAAERFPNFDVGEKRLGVIVWENAVARIPLTRELFTGPYDLRWGAEGDHQKIVFCGGKLAGLEDVEISSTG
jgi:hypothetical protein